MNKLKRWTTSIVSSFDYIISQVENHEAVLNSALRDVQEAGARARVQHKRVKQDGERLRRKLLEVQDAEDQWKIRAKKNAETDQGRALECLRRSKRAERERLELEEQAREHSELERKLSRDLIAIDERITQLSKQRNILKSRETRAEALKAIKHHDAHLFSEIDEIFDRWETQVTRYEYEGGCALSTEDNFEQDFLSEEEESSLKAELEELMAAN